jgi:hypothetical protein
MTTPPGHEPDPDSDDRVIFGTHFGDLGVIAIAAMCTLALLLILILPSPFAALEKQQAAAEKAEKQKKIDEAVASGVVTVGIIPKKK